MQDPDPLPWGALDRYQAHFIVRKDVGPAVLDYTARAVTRTRGRFGSKKLVSASWDGGRLAQALNGDAELGRMMEARTPREAEITVEPTENAVRIHGRWQNRHDLGITREMFDIYDRIAGHVRSL